MDRVIRVRTVKTAKAQKCWGCEREMPAGSEMRIVVSSDDGRISTNHWCKTCQVYMHEYCDDGDDYALGDLRYNSEEVWEEIRKKVEGT